MTSNCMVLGVEKQQTLLYFCFVCFIFVCFFVCFFGFYFYPRDQPTQVSQESGQIEPAHMCAPINLLESEEGKKWPFE